MKIMVPVQLVPDLVEELVIAGDNRALDPDSVRWILSEFDDHAIEQAILLKESSGSEVIVVVPDFDGASDVLYNAAARGADQLIKISADLSGQVNSHALVRLFLPVIQSIMPDMVLTGVQAHNALDGPVGALMAGMLDWPYVGYVSGVSVDSGKAIVRKEYPGGLIGEMAVSLPVVLGIQASTKPPRYIPVSKVNQFRRSAKIVEESGDVDNNGGLMIKRFYQPESTHRAAMIEGDMEVVADQLVALMKEKGAL